MADLGITLSAGGEKAFKEALKSVTAQIEAVESGMNDAVQSMDGLDSAEAKQAKSAQKAAKAEDLHRQKIGMLEEQQRREEDRLQSLAAALEEAKEKHGEDSDEVQKANEAYVKQQGVVAKAETAVNKAKAALAKLVTGQKQATDASEESEDTLEGQTKAQDQAGSSADTLAKKISSMASIMKVQFVADAAKAVINGLAGIAGKLAGCVQGCWDLTSAAAQMAGDVQSEAAKLNIGEGLYQELKYAADQVGVDTGTIVTAMKTMDKNVAKPSRSARRAFKQLGVSLKDAEGNAKSSETVFKETVDALAKIEDPAKRDKLALQLFGVKASELDGLLQAGGEAFQGYRDEASELGAVMSGDALSNLSGFKSQLTAMTTAATGVQNAFANQLTPVFSPFADAATQAMADVTNALNSGLDPESVQTLATNLTTNLTSAINGLDAQIQGCLPVLTSALQTLFDTLGPEIPGIVDTIAGTLTDAVSGLFTALETLVDPLVEAATTLLTKFADYLAEHAGTIADKAIDLVMSLVDGITGALPDLIPAAISIITQLATSLIDALPDLVARVPEIAGAIVDGIMATDWLQVGRNIIDSIAGAFANIGSTILGWFTGAKSEVEGDSEATDWSGVGETIKGSVSGVLSGIGGILSDGFSVAKGLIETMPWGDAAGVVSGAFSAIGSIGSGLADGFSGAVTAIQGIDWTSLGGTISGALGGALDALKSVGGGIWDAITGWFGGDEVKDAENTGSDILDGVTSGMEDTAGAEAAATAAGTAIRTALEAELSFAYGQAAGTTYGQGISDAIREADQWNDAGANVASGLKKGMEKKKSDPKSAGESLVTAAYDGMKAKIGWNGSKFEGLGKDIAKGLAVGIKGAKDEITGAVNEVMDLALQVVKKRYGIASPSRVWRDEVGVWLSRGMALGITDGIGDVRRAVGQLGDAASPDGIGFGSGGRYALAGAGGIHVVQNIYADSTSYAAQQRQAAKQLRDIARRI